jgi:hypothetical protein
VAIFTDTQVRQAGRAAAAQSRSRADSVLAEDQALVSYDVFLSHSIRDAEIVLGVRTILEQHGQKVYVDWIHDPHLDRANVTKKSADSIRRRMRQCAMLVYIHTENSPDSKWMPWELGYFDGIKGNVAIFPITRSGNDEFRGQEYLGLYPYIDRARADSDQRELLWANRNQNEYATFDAYKRDVNSIRVQ